MKERCVKSYGQYLKRLKERFGEIEQMPSDDDVRTFIKQYDLDKDWKIVVSEVKADIAQIILKRKGISTYKEYLVTLRQKFGIPDTMPDISRIESFIEEYNLNKKYGIKADDVKKDLENFIAGKYDEMFKDAERDYKPSVKRYVSRPYMPVRTENRGFFRSIHIPTHTISTLPKPNRLKQKPLVQNNRQNIQKSESLKSERNNKKAKGKERNTNIKQETTILIDGDNHINEGKKGIEHTTKDTKVIAYFSQEGAKKKFDDKYKHRPNVSSKFVEPGNQAVDNQIKSDAGKLLENKNQKVKIVSQDKGYDKYIKRKNKSEKRISRAESVSNRSKRKK